MSLETPLHKAQGLGAAHAGVSHFFKQRASAIALIPLSLWFAISALGLVGAPLAAVLNFLFNPVNAALMAAFILTSLYHMVLGLQEVILDYVPHPGAKFALMFLNHGFALVLAAASIFALLRVVAA